MGSPQDGLWNPGKPGDTEVAPVRGRASSRGNLHRVEAEAVRPPSVAWAMGIASAWRVNAARPAAVKASKAADRVVEEGLVAGADRVVEVGVVAGNERDTLPNLRQAFCNRIYQN